MNSKIKIATGILAGTVLGASIALLFAPKKGSKTRKLIGEQAKHVSDTVGNKYHETVHRLRPNHKERERAAV